ncbi:MAG: hypothetical protein AAF717_21355 [Bacteroidota bacterium]|nr:hypothetical protein [uncultured Allomuricauda sp.]
MNRLVTKMETKRANLFMECLAAYKENKFVETDIEAKFLSYDSQGGECEIELTSSRDIIGEVFIIGEHMDIRFEKLN